MITELAPAKINLALHVRRRRADGYHELETLFAFARDGDVVTVEPARIASFTIAGPLGASLLGTGDNLVTRAAAAFAVTFGVDQPHAITLDKHLPIASGVGGGSADAAATLRALARLHGITRDDPRLFAVAAALGADVPACLLGRTALGTGKGDTLVPVDGLPQTPLLLVNPLVAVSTAAVFARWDGVDRGPIPNGDLRARAAAGRNDLEAPARRIAPVIGDVLAFLAETAGADLVRMSGSGATCFTLYNDAGNAAAAGGQVRRDHPSWWCLESALA